MRTFKHVINSVFTLSIFGLFLGINPTFAQSKFIKDLKKAAEESAKRTVERKVEDKTAEKTDEAVEAVFDAPNIFRSKKNSGKTSTDESDNPSKTKEKKAGNSKTVESQSTASGRNISIADQFIPNGQVMYTDNFERDALGDFPSRWETNSGGEIVTVDDFKALRTSGTGYYTPLFPDKLPENYAVEFDLFTYNLEYKGTSALRFEIHLVEQPLISKSKKGAGIEMPLWYGGASDYFLVETYGTASKISNKIPYDYTEKLNDIIHFTLIKNGKRVRLFLDETKVIDIPSLASDNLGKYIQFYVREVDLQKDLVVAFANLKITEEGEDLRSKLLKAEGFSTTAILFQTASDKLQPASFDFLDELGQVLKEDEFLRIQIIGHTDSDGDDSSNQVLSEKRALSVANYLTEKFGISDSRLQAIGRGESEPVNSNSSAAEKAANRRVEFKKF
jgi:outer membrane protein OmpA-like peptidoglycan-associated protein